MQEDPDAYETQYERITRKLVSRHLHESPKKFLAFQNRLIPRILRESPSDIFRAGINMLDYWIGRKKREHAYRLLAILGDPPDPLRLYSMTLRLESLLDWWQDYDVVQALSLRYIDQLDRFTDYVGLEEYRKRDQAVLACYRLEAFVGLGAWGQAREQVLSGKITDAPKIFLERRFKALLKEREDIPPYLRSMIVRTIKNAPLPRRT